MATLKLNTQKNALSKDSLTEKRRQPITQEMLEQFERREASIEELLIFCSENYCSDLYIKEGDEPYIYKSGFVHRVPCYPTSKDIWEEFQEKGHITHAEHGNYMENLTLDNSVRIRIPKESPLFGVDGNTEFRYRASYSFSEDHRIATFRMITVENPTLENLNFPEVCIDALKQAYGSDSGIIYLTGPTGSGKTTTQTACFNSFTEPGSILNDKVIIGLEDPIEYQFKQRENVKINQKELNQDFKNFEVGVKIALREHPNIVLIGECRDKPVINAAIEAARTGHLVSTSFHADDVGGTINRLCYHLENDRNLIYDLIINLRLIMSQRMIKGVGVDTQFMVFNDEITGKILDIVHSGEIISTEINKMFEDEELLAKGLVKDWDMRK